MSFTLHYGGLGRAFAVADSLPGEDDELVPYDADSLRADIKATVDNGGGWVPILLTQGGMVTVWVGEGVPMYVTESDDDEDLMDALADLHDAAAGTGGDAEVLDLAPARAAVAPRTFTPGPR